MKTSNRSRQFFKKYGKLGSISLTLSLVFPLLVPSMTIVSRAVPNLEIPQSSQKSPTLAQIQTLTAQGKNQEAIAACQVLLTTNLDAETKYLVQMQLALLYSYEKEYQNSFNVYEQLLNDRPNDTTVKFKYAEVLSWSKRYRPSIRRYNELLKIQPDNLEAQLNRAEVLSWDGQYDAAIGAYRQILKTQPQSEKALIGLAQIAHWRGDLNTARDQLLALRQRFPESTRLTLELAKIYYTRQEIKLALKTLEPLLAVQNKEAIALVQKIRSIQSQTEVKSLNRSSQQNSIAVTETIKFRVNDSNTLQSVQIGYGKFTQPGREVLHNYPIRVGIEGTNAPIRWNLTAGADLFDRISTKPFVQGNVTAQMSPTVQIGATANYQAFKENVVTLENNINVGRIQPHVFWQITPSTSLYAQYGIGFYSDGNRDGQLWAGLKQEIGDFYVSGSVMQTSFANDPQNSYFAPSDYFLYSGELGWLGQVSPDATCNLALSIGQQSYSGNSSPANAYKAGCKINILPNTTIETQYQHSTNALFSGGNNSSENRFQFNLNTQF